MQDPLVLAETLMSDVDEYYKKQGYKYEGSIFEVTKDNKESRINKIKSFTVFNGFSILISIEILNECIDIKECDSIYFTYCSNSKIKNITARFKLKI